MRSSTKLRTGILSRRGRLWKTLRWLLLAGSLVSVVLFLSPNLLDLRRVSGSTKAGVRIVPAPSDTSYPAAVDPRGTGQLVLEEEIAAPATPPGAEVLQPSGSSEAGWAGEGWFRDSASAALDCIIDPYEIIELGSPVAGIIEAVHVDRSDEVKAGELLVELDAGVERAAVELARARAGLDGEIKSREADLDFRMRKRQRAGNLFDQKALSLDLREEIETEATIARLELQRAGENQILAKLQLAQAREALKRRSIRSPVDGVVVERLMSVGERVDEETILTIAQIDPLRVEVILPSAMFGSVRPTTRVAVVPEFGDTVHVAPVTIVDPIVDAASGTFGIQLELPNPDHSIHAGLHCKVRFLDD
jgi:RND family efflux transporter MFP subunit